MSRYRIAKIDDLEPGALLRVDLEGRGPVCLARISDAQFCAIDDTCTHEEQSLSEGDLEGWSVECPAHGSRFDLKTGEVAGFPATEPTRAYTVQVEDDDIVLDDGTSP